MNSSIQNVSLEEVTDDEILKLQETLRDSKVDKQDIRDSLVKMMINRENWDFQKAVNIVNLMDAAFSSTPFSPPQFEKLLKFPSKESEKQLKHYLSLSQEKIIVCMYTFTNRQLMDELISAKDRGVHVRLITDKESLSTLYIHEMAAIGIE